ncbi:MAG: hypothetical protein AB7N91_17370 [Candidatus Tectimicrobiota bacterium]
MQPVIEQATHALQLGRFETVKTLVSTALDTSAAPDARHTLLELLAQAQSGLQDHEAAVRSWEAAYQQASTPDDKSRLFEQARQALREHPDYEVLFRLAQAHLAHTRTPQERATCLLAAGEALIHLQRYQEARQQYLEPAMELPGLPPETRLHLWHYLGLGHLAEHTFLEAAAAFRQSADLALGQHFAQSGAQQAAQRAQLHHLRNAARFYEGIIHLIYQQPQQAIQSFQELQRPLTAVGSLNVALFLGLAHRILLQADTATRALQTLARTATSPDTLHGPAALVRAGIATIHEAPSVVGEHLEAALEAPLEPRTSWEPSWQAMLYRELALALHQLGCRDLAITCYEEALHVEARRSGTDAAVLPVDLHGAPLLTAVANLPCETWSAVVQGEMLLLLQTLASLYTAFPASGLTEQALALAARVATTPEQKAALCGQRGWLQVVGVLAAAPGEHGASTSVLLGEELHQAQSACQDTALAPVLGGIIALLRGETEQAISLFSELATIPEIPELQAFCVAAWLWAQSQQGTLEQVLSPSAPGPAPLWQTSMLLAAGLEILLAWTEHQTSDAPRMPWLPALLLHQPGPTLEALRLLCRPDYLPVSQQTLLLNTLAPLTALPEHAAIADQLVILFGGAALVTQIDALLETIDARLAAPVSTASQGARQRKQRQRREATPADQVATEITHVLHLITLLHSTAQVTGEHQLPERICGWLLRYTQLCPHTPEVVGALLGLLRQCPGSSTVMPTILEQVALSRRQRQALESALQAVPAAVSPVQLWLGWEDMPQWPVGRLLETLADVHRPAGPQVDAASVTRTLYVAAMLFARVHLPHRAHTTLQRCLQLQPAQPFVHYNLARLLNLQQQPEAALAHALQAWQHLAPLAAHLPILSLELLNQMLTFLATAHQYEQFPTWIAAFDQQRQALQSQTLSPAQQQRITEEEGTFALTRALYLASVPVALSERPAVLAQRLACLAHAAASGTPPIRQTALHRQAELQVALYHYDAALATYETLLQHWPEESQVVQQRALLLALHHPGGEPEAVDRLLSEALAGVFTRASTPPPIPIPHTPQEALRWLQQQAPDESQQQAELLAVLTAYAGVALQRQDIDATIALLTPLVAYGLQPQQAYYLATAHYRRSLGASSGSEALRDCEQALQYAQSILAYEPVMPPVMELLRQIEARHHSLLTVRQQEQSRSSYRRHICGLFSQHGVRFQDDVVDQGPGDAWVDIVEVADLDEASGKLLTTIHLHFNGQAAGLTPVPDEADIILYAQHQRDKQRLVELHGMEALPWPHTAYEGGTDFALLFPERLGLNRDLLFIAFADPHALIRYARVLHTIAQRLPQPQPGTATPDNAVLAAAARYLALIPLVRQRLHTLTITAPSKAVQRQMSELEETLATAPAPDRLQHCPTFLDGYGYFHAIVEAMRAHLDAPPAERASDQPEERQVQRPTRRKRRQGKERWREGDGERRREEYFSDVL